MGYDFSIFPLRNPSEIEELRLLLDEAVRRFNVPSFADSDPVQFPRRFASLPDREIAALLVATIAWGNRRMILRDASRMLDLMDNQPLAYILDGEFETLPDGLNIHRTFFARNLKNYLRALRSIYSSHGSLEAFAEACGAHRSETPAWTIAEALNAEICASNGCADSRCLPTNLKATALKRLNMALRWLVRDDGIVDPGGWSLLKSSQLFIPVDVHVARTALALGLTDRDKQDRREALSLTAALRQFRPDDPTVYDFALFGLGESGSLSAKLNHPSPPRVI